MNLISRGTVWSIGKVLAVRDYQLRVLLILLVLAIVIAIWVLSERIPGVDSIKEVIGYPGVFLLSFIGSASILLPVPGMAAVCAGGIFLFPFSVGLLAGVAEALGEFTGYGLGYAGRGMIEHRRIYQLARGWMQKRGTLVLFLASSVPNPAFDVIGIAAGGLRFPILRFFLAVWAGKTLKSMGVAYACYYSADAANKIFQWMSG